MEMREIWFRKGFVCACILAGATVCLRAQDVAPPAPPSPPPNAEVHVWKSPTGGSFLGIGLKEIDSDRAKELKLREESGVEITRVEENSPAAKAGLKVADVVLQYNGQRVEGIEQFSRFVHETPPGREVKLTVSRDGNLQTIVARIGSRKAMAWAPAAPEMPRVEMPPMPDIPHNLMMWRSSMLGIEAEPLRGQLAEYFGAKEGVLVRAVTRDSAAEKAGLKAGDVILKVNGTSVTTPGEITSVVRSLEAKKSVPIVLLRDHREMTVSATLESDRSDWFPAARPKAAKM
jgi:serine protease Do